MWNNSLVGGHPLPSFAQIEPRTSATVHVMLYFTWHPSDLTTGLHGQVHSNWPIRFSVVDRSHFRYQSKVYRFITRNSSLKCSGMAPFSEESQFYLPPVRYLRCMRVEITHKAVRDMACVSERSHSFTCHPHVHPQVEWTIPAFTPQPQSVTTRLQMVTHPSTECARHRVISLIETNALPLCQATTCR